MADLEMLILAGGMDNTIELTCSAQAKRVIAGAADKGCKVAAICAAPVVLAGMGLLNGRKAVCYPGMEGSMGTADVQVGSKVVVDGSFITGQGPGAAFDFALKLVEVLKVRRSWSRSKRRSTISKASVHRSAVCIRRRFHHRIEPHEEKTHG